MDTGQDTLLVVDDSALNREALSRRLARRGYTVIVATDAQQALAQIAEHPAGMYVHFTYVPPQIAAFFPWLLKVDRRASVPPS